MLQLQSEMERKNRERKDTNNEFYNSLANENRELLNSLRVGKQSTLKQNLIPDRSMVNSAINISRMGEVNQTPYEQRFGVNTVMREIPNIHHESVFINSKTTRPNIQSTNEILDELISSYQPPGANSGEKFTLPMPQSSFQNQNKVLEDQPYNDNIIDVEENEIEDIDVEDSLNKLVDEVDKANTNDKLQQ